MRLFKYLPLIQVLRLKAWNISIDTKFNQNHGKSAKTYNEWIVKNEKNGQKCIQIDLTQGDIKLTGF